MAKKKQYKVVKNSVMTKQWKQIVCDKGEKSIVDHDDLDESVVDGLLESGTMVEYKNTPAEKKQLQKESQSRIVWDLSRTDLKNEDLDRMKAAARNHARLHAGTNEDMKKIDAFKDTTGLLAYITKDAVTSGGRQKTLEEAPKPVTVVKDEPVENEGN